MTSQISPHDAERDRIATTWFELTSFQCQACREERDFPAADRVETEVRFEGTLRADVAALDFSGNIRGIVEVVRSNPPSERVLASQSMLEFAFYRRLPYGNVNSESVWLCSPECWKWYVELAGRETSQAWDAPRCDDCGRYFHQNPLSWYQFRDWDNPYYVFCIHCAAGHTGAQWRSPGELAGGDPREWTPDDDADPAALFLSYCDAAFWSMVWASRVEKLDQPDVFVHRENTAAEDAAADRLVLVRAALDDQNLEIATNLLLPVGAPGWAYYPGEEQRMLAFRPENCQGTAEAWARLLQYRKVQLPDDLFLLVDTGSSTG